MKRTIKTKEIAPPSTMNEGSSWHLQCASFICGAAVMVLEMTGSRVVAPYMGTSLVVWTSLIGIIMASLCIGYWLGGVIADKYPKPQYLAYIILAAAISTALMGFVANPILDFLAASLSSLYASSVLAALLLFFIPSVLLGMVSPFIVRLAMKNLGSAGATVGRFSALSSAGSILGTFLGGFILISFFSSGTILMLIASTLALTSWLIHRSGQKLSAPAVLLFLLCAVYIQVYGIPMANAGEHIETLYNHIVISDRNSYGSARAIRLMQTDPMGAQSLVYLDDPVELVSDYTKFYDLAFHYHPQTKHVLMLGGGGYCVPRKITAQKQDVSIDVVELDPGITQAARDFFFLKDSPKLSIFHEDARIFLNRAAQDVSKQGRYDAIFEDVFGSWYNIPFHLTTVECMRNVQKILSKDGVFVVNVISALEGEQSGVFHGIYSSIAEVFPKVLIFPASLPDSPTRLQNVMIVAFNNPDQDVNKKTKDPYLSQLLSHEWKRPFTPTVKAFSDSFAPIEKYILR